MTARALRILITAGGTREPIDDVRFIGNLSTGTTGAALAQAFAAHGHCVTLLRGQGAAEAVEGIDSESFSSGADLWKRLSARLAASRYDAVVMAAAVADYAPASPVQGKIRSDARELVVTLARTPKLLPMIKSASPAPLIVIGFKLTSRAGAAQRIAAVDALWSKGGVDAVVQNDLAEIRSAPVHPFHLHRAPQTSPTSVYGAAGLATALEAFVRARLPH